MLALFLVKENETLCTLAAAVISTVSPQFHELNRAKTVPVCSATIRTIHYTCNCLPSRQNDLTHLFPLVFKRQL